MFPITLNHKTWGYMDASGKQLCPCNYDNALPATEGLGCVWLDKKVGFIDATGKVQIPLVYDHAEPFSDGRAVVKIKDRFGYIDSQGSLVIPAKYSVALTFSDGLALVKYEDAHAYIDRFGNEALASPFTSRHGGFHDGHAVGRLNDASVVIDKSGKITGEARSGTHMSYFSEGLCPIEIGDRMGYMNTRCEIVIKPEFDSAHIFSEGLAGVKVGGKWGFTDRNGKLVIQPRYAKVGYCREGLIRVGLPEDNPSTDITLGEGFSVTRAKAYGYIDKSGKLQIAASFEMTEDFRDGLALHSGRAASDT